MIASTDLTSVVRRFYILILIPALFLSGCTGGGGGGAPGNTVTPAAWVGTQEMGSTVAGMQTYGTSVATDVSGNVYTAGYTNNLGAASIGSSDFFVTKFGSNGSIVNPYPNLLGGRFETYGYSVATDTNGNVYVAGYTAGGLDGNTSFGGSAFVTKYDNTGVKQYTKLEGATGVSTTGFSVATDTNGNVYVAGYTTGGLDGNTLTGANDFFLTKYDSTGVKQYTKQLGVAGAITWGQSVATDSNGNVYVAGYTNGGLDGNTLSGVGDYDFFVTKFSSAGVKQYTKQLGVAGANSTGYAVATDTNGNVYVAGTTSGGLDGNTMTGTLDFFLTKYDNTGLKQYTKQLGVAGASTSGNSVASDSSGNVYVTGNTNGGLDGNTLTGTNDFFLTKYDSTGVKQYTKQLGVAGASTSGKSVATDASHNVYVAGTTYGYLDSNYLIGVPYSFVTKYNSAGVKQ